MKSVSWACPVSVVDVVLLILVGLFSGVDNVATAQYKLE